MSELTAKSFWGRLGATFEFDLRNCLCADVQAGFGEQTTQQGMSGRTRAWTRPGGMQWALLLFLVLVFAQEGLGGEPCERMAADGVCGARGSAGLL